MVENKMIYCENCKRQLAEEATGSNVHNEKFIVAYNKAIIELNGDDKALSTFSLAVFDTMEQFAINNNKSLLDFVSDMFVIYEKIKGDD